MTPNLSRKFPYVYFRTNPSGGIFYSDGRKEIKELIVVFRKLFADVPENCYSMCDSGRNEESRLSC